MGLDPLPADAAARAIFHLAWAIVCSCSGDAERVESHAGNGVNGGMAMQGTSVTTWADAAGNGQVLGPDPFFDDLFCRAADRAPRAHQRELGGRGVEDFLAVEHEGGRRHDAQHVDQAEDDRQVAQEVVIPEPAHAVLEVVLPPRRFDVGVRA